MQTPEKGTSEATMGITMICRRGVFVIRHSERLDEIDKDAYREWVDTQCETSTRSDDKYCLASDPPITERGKVIASEMAETIARFFPPPATAQDISGGGEGIECKESDEAATRDVSPSSTVPILYCSKMQRAVETAYPIALRLGVPLRVSSGLSLTAAAVEKREKSKRPFKFLSMAEISALVPGVALIDYDEVEEVEEAALAAAATATAATASASASVQPPLSLSAAAAGGGGAPVIKEERRMSGRLFGASDISANGRMFVGKAQEKQDKRWLRCIKSIMRNHRSEHEQVLIVAHRETTRSLLERTTGRRPERLPTPYCCIANFSIDEASLQLAHCGQSWSLDRFLTHEGKSIEWR